MKTTQTWKIGDCLQLLPDIPDKSVDMILTDLPYGTTACKWDTIIPFEPLWKQYERIIKDNGAVVLTASQPFTSKLVISNIEMFKYEWIWEKDRPSNINCGKFQPMKYHENILVFGKDKINYNPIKIKRDSKRVEQGIKNNNIVHGGFKSLNGNLNYKEYSYNRYDPDYKNPSSILKYPRQQRGLMPAQKPLALFEYLIKTYTNEGDTVHDSCLGSGTTLEACANLNRNCIGFEISPDWEGHYRKRLKLDNTKLDAWTIASV